MNPNDAERSSNSARLRLPDDSTWWTRGHDRDDPRGEEPAASDAFVDILGGTLRPVELDPLHFEPSSGGFSVSGFDPIAPRPLLLWRLRNGRVAVMARGESRADGSLAFPPLVTPGEGVEVVVTGRDGLPDSRSASLSRELGPRLPEAPRARVMLPRDGEILLHIVASEATGVVLLADVDAHVIGRYPLTATPIAAARILDVAVSLPDPAMGLLLGHEFADGRRSEWRPVRVATASGEESE